MEEQQKRFIVNLDEKITRVLDGVSDIKEDISAMKVVQAEQALDLKYHIERTDLNESRIFTLEEKLLPILEAKSKLDWTFRLLGKGTAGAGVVFGAIKAIETLLKWVGKA